jgi:hypothetical protein
MSGKSRTPSSGKVQVRDCGFRFHDNRFKIPDSPFKVEEPEP